MPTTYTLINNPQNKFDVVGSELRLRSVLLAGASASALVERNIDGIVDTVNITVRGVPKVREVKKTRGKRNVTTPQAYHNYVAMDSADPNTHPSMGTFTHAATKNGLWSDPTVWDVGTVPGANAIVNTSTFDIVYDVESDVLVKDIHVAGPGILRWATDKDTRLWVDTLMVHGTLIMGEPGNPIPESDTAGKPRAEIVFWQSEAPLATTRLGLMTMGPVRMQGAVKKYALRATASIAIGATSVTLNDVSTSGWRVGDTILFPATENAGSSTTDAQYIGPTQFYGPDGGPAGVQVQTTGFRLSQDEERTITSIVGNVVSWTNGLLYDHKLYAGTLPRGEVVTLNPIVANKSRSIQMRTAGGKAGDTAIWAGANLTVLQKRAHSMFMFSDDVQVRGIRALDMGRTDTNPSLAAPIGKIDEADPENGPFIAYDKPPADGTRVQITDPNNVRGRYPLHIHGTGPFLSRKQVALVDCVVDTSPGMFPIPGWAITHHNSRAGIENCIVHNVRGAGMVSEVANEIGHWINNLVCHARGDGYRSTFGSRAEWWQNHNDHYGLAFANQARQVLMQGNHATSSHKAYGWMQQDVQKNAREPDYFSLRLSDPIAKASSSAAGYVNTHPEQPQIPDFINNTFASCGQGLYVEHRLNSLDRNDETPMIMRGFHGLNSGTMFNLANYSQHYYVFDSLWDGFTGGAGIGPVASSFNFANILLRNGVTGFNNGHNYGGFVIDCEFENVTTPVADLIHSVSTQGEDPSAHPYYNVMDEWVVTDNNVPNPGYTVRVRTGRVLNSATDLPVPYPKPPLGRYMPDGSPPVAFGGDPYFLLDTAVSQLDTSVGPLTIAGTIRDCVGDRRFGDYQNPEAAMLNFSVKVGRLTTFISKEDIVRRNGCFNDNGVWKSRLWFIYADRATGKYFFPTVDVLVGTVQQSILDANAIGPNDGRPVLPLKPELLREGPYVRPSQVPDLVSTMSVETSIGLKLFHPLLAADGQVKWSIVGGTDAAEFEIITVAGMEHLRLVGDAVAPTARIMNVTIRLTDQFGNFEDIPHTVTVAAKFVDDFTGTNGQALEARAGWTLVSGAASSGTIVSNGLKRNGIGLYYSTNMGSKNIGTKFRTLSSNGSSQIVLRHVDADNHIRLYRFANTIEIGVEVANVTTTASYSDVAGVNTDVFAVEVNEGVVTLKKNGVVLTPSNGTVLDASALTGTRQGVNMTSSVGSAWIEDYETYAL